MAGELDSCKKQQKYQWRDYLSGLLITHTDVIKGGMKRKSVLFQSEFFSSKLVHSPPCLALSNPPTTEARGLGQCNHISIT